MQFLIHSFLNYALLAQIGVKCLELENEEVLSIKITYSKNIIRVIYEDENSNVLNFFKTKGIVFPFKEFKLIFRNLTVFLPSEY